MEHEQIIQELRDVLQQWIGRKVLVTKEENGDIDQTLIDLERFDQEVYENDLDDYMPKASFQLVGSGQTINQGAKAALPYSSFDIPLDMAEEIHCDAEGVFLRTGRALYTFTPV
ncbi:MAG: hypothetical protein ACO1OC_03245 [Tuberibacillus sp.]